MVESLVKTKRGATLQGTSIAAAGPATKPVLIADHEVSTRAARFRPTLPALNRTTLRLSARALDIIAATAIAWYCLSMSGASLLQSRVVDILPFAMAPVLAIWGLNLASAYEFAFNRRVASGMARVIAGIGLPLAAGVVASGLLGAGDRWAMLAALATGLALAALHAHYLFAVRTLTRSGHLSENVIIVGATPNAQRLIERNGESRELNIVGIFDDRLARAPRSVAGAPLLGRLDDLLNWDRLPEVDRIIVTITSDARSRVRELVDRLRVLPQRVVLLLDLDGFDPDSHSLSQIAHSPAAYVSGAPRDAKRAVVKRLSDLILASLMLVAFSPVMLAIAAAIKASSPGPVFFRQRRHGFNNQIIGVWKFRSMRDDPSAADRMTQQTIGDDPRITTIGRLIRQTSLDELPQLLNVLKGDMSIVGPRPHAVGMTSEETAVQSIVGDYAHRHRVKPGISGWAQVNGSRGPVHTRELVRERVRLDMEYVNRASLWFDLYIMAMTVPCLLGDARNVR